MKRTPSATHARRGAKEGLARGRASSRPPTPRMHRHHRSDCSMSCHRAVAVRCNRPVELGWISSFGMWRRRRVAVVMGPLERGAAERPIIIIKDRVSVMRLPPHLGSMKKHQVRTSSAWSQSARPECGRPCLDWRDTAIWCRIKPLGLVSSRSSPTELPGRNGAAKRIARTVSVLGAIVRDSPHAGSRWCPP